MSGYVSVVAALIVAALLGHWFIRNERKGVPEKTILFFLGFLILEAAIYQSQTRIPAGLIHPGFGVDPNPKDDLIETAFSFRLLDILIPLALWARLLGQRRRGGAALPTLAWAALLAWVSLAAVQGFILGNQTDLLLFEAKTVVYLGLLFVVLGADLGKMVSSRAFQRLLVAAAAVAVIVTATDAAGVEADLEIPLFPFSSFGLVGADAASIFGALGLVTLALAVTRASNRIPLLAMTAALMAPALIAQQRAALLGLGVSVILFCLFILLAPHRLKVTFAEGAVLLVGLVFVVGAVALVGAGVQGKPFAIPFVSSVEQSFARGDKALSAESRVNQWKAAPDVIAQRPWVGSGLGTTYLFYDPGPKDFIRSNLTHNVGLDLLIRTGIVGLALFSAALAALLWIGVRVWRTASDPVLAALAMAGAVIVSGLVAKGMVESLFEKYRLAAFMGLMVGIGLATLSRQLVRKTASEPEREKVMA